MKVIREILKDHYKYRKQIFKLAKADLIKTYKGAALGWAWAVIRPAITIATYYFAFSIGLRVSRPVGEYSYFLWLLAGITPWFYFSAVFTAGAGSIRKYSYLVTKIRYPVSTIPTIINLSHMTTHLVVLINGYDGSEQGVVQTAEYIQQLLRKYCNSDGGEYTVYR